VTPSPRPRPTGTPLGPQKPQKGGPFDPDAGIQVIVVAAFVGPGVADGDQDKVVLVPDDQFDKTFGAYTKIEQGIPVPVDRLL
jgi:hypothetical protein